jgi:hypothetical protein
MVTEDKSTSALQMDRALPIENTPPPSNPDGRRRISVKVANEGTEAIPISGTFTGTIVIGLQSTGLQSNISVLAATEVKVGASRLANRKIVVIQPTDGSVFMGFSSGVTTASGIEVFKKQTIFVDVTDTGQVWLVANSSTNVRIGEGA